MNYKLVFSDRAEADLEEIADHIAEDSARAAVRVVTAIRAKCELIARSPNHYVVREDIAPGFRRANQHPYAILFRVVGDNTIHIERIVHGARDLPSLFAAEE